MAKIKIQFAGGAESPTGSNFLITIGDKKILIDCGLYQGSRMATESNWQPFTYDIKTVDALFVTHAHLDHVGRIPKLMHDGYDGPIYSTPPTKDMAAYIMEDSLSVLTKEAQRDGLEPLYNESDVARSLSNWHSLPYHEVLPLHTSEGIVTFKFLDAGHILGSSMVDISLNGKRLVFTGDLGNNPNPLMRDTEPLKGVNYLAIESVYGDRNHEDIEDRVKLLRDAIKDTAAKSGVLLIPAFSIERTQELLYYINNMVESATIPAIDMYLDSPLAINITKVYKKYETYFNDSANSVIKYDDIFNFKGLHITETKEESKAINTSANPKVIIAGSGMMSGGRIMHHAEQHLGNPNTTLLLVGYQAAGTTGRMLQDGADHVHINGVDVKVRAKVIDIHGFSAHKDSEHLQALVGAAAESIEKVFVILGEPKSAYFLAQRLGEHYGLDAKVPQVDEVVELEM